MTIEQGMLEESAHIENTPNADLSQRMLRLSLGTSHRGEKSALAALLEDQVKTLT